MLWVAAITAAVAALFGWFNATGNPIELTMPETLERHRWLGVATAAVTALTLVLWETQIRQRGRAWARVFDAALLAAVVLVAITGHNGGELVFGENYLPW